MDGLQGGLGDGRPGRLSRASASSIAGLVKVDPTLFSFIRCFKFTNNVIVIRG